MPDTGSGATDHRAGVCFAIGGVIVLMSALLFLPRDAMS